MWHSCQKILEHRIHALPSRSVFAISDFLDVATSKTVSKMLARVEETHEIEGIMRGIYWKPDGLYASPDPDHVARALARENTWRLVPCGETALHLFGLEGKKPNKWTYVTDGTYRSYSYDNITIRFLHTTGKILSAMSAKTALVVQVLKAYGKEHITDEVMARIASLINSDEAKKILEETRNTTDWIAKVIWGMFEKKSEESVL